MIRLLIADDEGFVRKGLLKNIKWSEHGIDVSNIEQADDGLSALEKAMEFKPNILITDVRMPHLNGIELASKIKGQFPDCQIIFMSAYSDKEYLKSAINLKAVSYVEKPIDPDEISKAISNAVAMFLEQKNFNLTKLEVENTSKQILESLRTDVLFELINPDYNSAIISKRLQAAKIEFSTDSFYCAFIIKISPDSSSNIKFSNELTFDLKQSLYTTFNSEGASCLCAYKDNYTLVGIVYPVQTNSDYLNNIFKHLIEAFKYKMQIFISAGAIVKGTDNILLSYNSAEQHASELFFTGYNCLVFSSLPKEDIQNKYDDAIETFISHILKDDIKNAVEIVKKLTQDIKNHNNNTTNSIKNLYFLLLIRTIEQAEKKNITLYSETSESYIWQKINAYSTLDDLESYTIHLLDSYFVKVNEKASISSLVSCIIKTIKDNYTEPNLSIKSLGLKLYMSPAYLCTIYKKETGKTINHYITELRIEKAMELLKDRSMKFLDISISVGYLDQNYFTKVFKKNTNMTPSEYRERFFI